jgi:tRNA A-37 threonylcarbamoyl transferase component Bud32
VSATYRAGADHEEVLARAGITDYESAMGFTGGSMVAAHRGRSVVRFGGTLFLKRFIERPREARRETRAMERLADCPGGPEPVPLAAEGRGPRGAFLVTAQPPGSVPLDRALSGLEGERRRTILRAVGERIRALHDRGLTCPDLMAHHLIVALPDRVFLIDAARLARRGGAGARARDLAALDRSLPYGVARATDRVRILAAYLGRRPRGDDALLRDVRHASEKLARRRRYRRGSLVASPAEREFLAAHGIRSFDDLMGHAGEGVTRLRLLPDRENLRVELGGRVFFVKRHRPVKDRGPTPAAAEWEAVHLLRRAGIRAMRAVAMGEDVEGGSTIWVERARGEPLDDLLRRGDVGPAVRREIGAEAAWILRRMRLREIHHRDMYLCHLIADLDAPAGERLTVIDLQRARSRPGLRKRWYVKDVAALLHSAPRPPVTRTDATRFLRDYFAVRKLGPSEKAFARKVVAKSAQIARHSREPFEK